MESIKREQGVVEEQQQPLLENAATPQKPPKTAAQKAIRRTFKGTAHLSKLLPTGSVLTFQFFSPVLTHQGQCVTPASQYLTLGFLILCSLSCFFVCFTDTFRDERGKVRYGFATLKGLWLIDGSAKLPAEEAASYRIRFMDILHALMSILVFGAISLFDKNVVKCLFPTLTEDMKELLVPVPIGIGVTCTILFLIFPSKRHGVGTPLSAQ